MYYVAKVEANGTGFTITVPDLPEVITEGATFREAIDMGKEALLLTIEEYKKAGRILPEPRGLLDLCKEDPTASYCCINF
jgi:predicted RNase H-like HicB family nuclease